MSSVTSDLRLAIRSLRRSAGFTTAVVATLGLGIGIATAVFSLLQGMVLRPLPYPEADRLVTAWETDEPNESFTEGFSVPDFVDVRTAVRGLDRIAALSFPQLNLRPKEGPPERITGGAATADLLPLLGARPVLGRLFSAAEDRPNGPRVVVLGHALWERAFGADPAIVGRSIRLDGQTYEVIGVLAPSFAFDEAELYVPMSAATPFLDVRGVHNLQTVARLRPGVQPAAATAELTGIARTLAARYPDDNVGRSFRIEPLRTTILGPLGRELWILAGAVGLVLLITCANVAGLWLLRAHGRRREMAVRVAIGAARRHLFSQGVVEALVLSAASTLAAVAIAQVALRALVAARPGELPHGLAVGLDPQALLFAAGVGLLTALLFGVAPLAIAAFRGRAGALGTRDEAPAMRSGARAVLVVAEVALAMVLVTGTGLLARSLWHLLQVEPGFVPDRVTSFGIRLPDASYPMPARDRYPEWPEVISAYHRIVERIEAIPGVQRVALALNNPSQAGWTSQADIVGRPVQPGPHDEVRVRPVTPAYHQMLRVPLLAGRYLEPADRAGGAPVTLVNAALVRKYFPDGRAVGAAISFWGRELRIVGVVGDERFRGLDRESEPAIYPSLEQLPFSAFRILVASGLPASRVEREVRATVAQLEPDVGLYEVAPLADTLARSYGQRRFLLTLLASFGSLALALAAVGIYGLISFQVAQRRRELGVRQALGAVRRDLVRLVVGEGARLAFAGVLLGGLGGMLAAPVLMSLLFGVRPLDAGTFGVSAGLLAGVALAAAWIPASRAARVDPTVALRGE